MACLGIFLHNDLFYYQHSLFCLEDTMAHIFLYHFMRNSQLDILIHTFEIEDQHIGQDLVGTCLRTCLLNNQHKYLDTKGK